MGDSESAEDSSSDVSEIFGLSPEERTLVRKSWMTLHKKANEGAKVQTSQGMEPVIRVFYK
jgi:hypothetical protein